MKAVKKKTADKKAGPSVQGPGEAAKGTGSQAGKETGKKKSPLVRMAAAYLKDSRKTVSKVQKYRRLRRRLSRAAALGVRLYNAFHREMISR